MTTNNIKIRSLYNLFDSLVKREAGCDNEITLPSLAINKYLLTQLIDQAKIFIHNNDAYKPNLTKDIINQLVDGYSNRQQNSMDNSLNLPFTF
jgi:hypothetical protein